MILTSQHIEFITDDLQKRGIWMKGLSEDILDHICCQIEASEEEDFDLAYKMALSGFGENGINKLQKETYRLLFKKEIIMKKITYVLGYIATTLCTSGMLFKIMHWPGANMLLLTGVALLNFGFLPMYFYQKYKSAVA